MLSHFIVFFKGFVGVDGNLNTDFAKLAGHPKYNDRKKDEKKRGSLGRNQ